MLSFVITAIFIGMIFSFYMNNQSKINKTAKDIEEILK